MLFSMDGGVFRLVEKQGYPQEQFHYPFLEQNPELWTPVLEKGSLLLEDHASEKDRSLWIFSVRQENIQWLLLAEIPKGEKILAKLVQTEFLERTKQPMHEIPVWQKSILANALKIPSPVLVVAEPGSGKEEFIHAFLDAKFGTGQSANFFQPARLSQAVQLRELFGDSAGARLGDSGAVLPIIDRPGSAIVIQEASDLASVAQLKILDSLSAEAARKFWIFETSMDLAAMVSVGKFQAGLFRTLESHKVVLPPLRINRSLIRQEATRLIAELRQKYRRSIELSESGYTALENYDWPGNWHELRRGLEGAFLLCKTNEILPADLRLGSDSSADGDDLNLRKRSRELEHQLLLQAYALHGGNQVQMAKALGISRGSLQYKLQKYRIE